MPSPHSLQSSSLEHQHLQLDVSSAPGCQQPLPQKAFLQTPGTAHSGQQSMLDSNLSRVFWNPLTGEAPERPAFISLSSVLKWRGGREGEMEREKRGRGRDTIFIFRLPSSLRADSVLLLNPESPTTDYYTTWKLPLHTNINTFTTFSFKYLRKLTTAWWYSSPFSGDFADSITNISSSIEMSQCLKDCHSYQRNRCPHWYYNP